MRRERGGGNGEERERPARVALKGVASALFAPSARVEDVLARLVATLGNNAVAGLVGADRAQVSRWVNGRERVPSAAFARLVDLDYVLTRLLQSLYPDDAAEWLDSASPWLQGARPIDVLRAYGLAPVARALDALEQGAYL